LEEGVLSFYEPIPFESKLCRNLTSSSSSSGIYCRIFDWFAFEHFIVGGTFEFDSSLAGVRTRGAFTRIFRTEPIFNAGALVVDGMRIGKNHGGLFRMQIWRDDQDAGVGWSGMERKFRV
jgi:hypothetical protein